MPAKFLLRATRPTLLATDHTLSQRLGELQPIVSLWLVVCVAVSRVCWLVLAGAGLSDEKSREVLRVAVLRCPSCIHHTGQHKHYNRACN